MNRRHVIQSSLLAWLVAAVPRTLKAQSLVTRHLRNNLHLITGAGCNVLVAIGEDSVLVVDGGLPGQADAVLREINRLGEGKPVAFLFNTNWREEHCGLNYVLGPAGTRILAHENTRLWQGNDFYVAWEDRHHTPMPAEAQANTTFYKTGSLQLGSEPVHYGFISPFHTDGDIYVHFPESNVLVAGDMLRVGAYPLLDFVTGGWIGGAQESTAGLVALCDGDTLVVPAEGDVQGVDGLSLQQAMLDHAYEKVADAYRTGRSLDQFTAADPMADYRAQYGDDGLFLRLLYRGTWYHVPGRAIQGII